VNFRPDRKDKPELNLIPLIDVLIVLLIFLVLTTTFSRETALRIQLPEVKSNVSADPAKIQVEIDARGGYSINGNGMASANTEELREAMRAAASGEENPSVSLRADRMTPHQAVMRLLDVAGQLGYGHISFMASPSNESTP
jgi:biopolymer transport protein ExbD